MNDIEDRLDRPEAQLEAADQRLADHERTPATGSVLARARAQLRRHETSVGGTDAEHGVDSDALPASDSAALDAGNADPTGQVGTPDRPVEVVHAAALAGPLTDGEELDSLVGEGLTIEDGTLTLGGQE